MKVVRPQRKVQVGGGESCCELRHLKVSSGRLHVWQPRLKF